jgi:hypothetical protein
MQKFLASIITTFTLTACVSQVVPFEEHINGWLGGKIEQFIEVRNLPHVSRENSKGTEQITQLENGNKLYEFPYRICPVFFEVNFQGVIVNITTENNKACY